MTQARAWFEQLRAQLLPMGSLRRSLVSGAFWSLTGAVFSRGFVLLSSIIIARLLGKTGYGGWGLVLSTVTMFAQFAIFGVALTATKHVAEFRRTDPARAGRILSLALVVGLTSISIMSLVCLAASHWLAYQLYRAPHLFVPHLLASVMLFGMVGAMMLQGALAGFEDFRRIARINAIQGLVLLLAAPPLAWSWGIPGTVVAMSASHLTAMALCLWGTIRNCREHQMPLSTTGIWQERIVLWKYAIPALLGGGVAGPAAALSKALVARIPNGLAGLGSFEAAFRWRTVVLFIPGAVRQVALPMLSRLKGENDRRRYIRILWANIVLNASIALAGAVPVMVLSPWILSLYGQNFRQDWDMMVILVGSGVFKAIKDVLARVTSSMGKMWWHVGMATIWGAVTLGGTYLLLPIYGVRGYVWAVAGATVVDIAMYALASTVILRRWHPLQEAQV